MANDRMSFEDFLKSKGIEDDFEDMVCIDAPMDGPRDGLLRVTRPAYDALERVAATQGLSVWDLVGGVVQNLGDDPDLLNYVSDAEGLKHEPEVLGLSRPWERWRGA